MRIALLIVIVLWSSVFKAQELTLQTYLNQVKKNHPALSGADLSFYLEQADLKLQRGISDPYLSLNFNEKDYNNSEYYSKNNFKLTIPTALGADIFVGYDQNTGTYLDPELNVPGSGLYQAGLALPIGPELIYNQRMMAIRQAKLNVGMAEQERKIAVNDLLYRAALAYLNWSLASSIERWQNEAIELANSQFEAVKMAYLGGDRPAIDTVEANLQVQFRTYQLNEAKNNVVGARLLLETFLWDEEGAAITVAETAEPEPMEAYVSKANVLKDSFLIWGQNVSSYHPDLLIRNFKIASYTLDKNQSLSNFFPSAELKYVQLAPGNTFQNNLPISMQDRMVGFSLKYPLLLRQERAKLNMATIKAEREQLALNAKSVELKNRIYASTNDFLLAEIQYQLYVKMADNYSALMDAERTKYAIGESSVFLLNTRENKLFDAQVAATETRAKQIASALKVAREAVRVELLVNRMITQ